MAMVVTAATARKPRISLMLYISKGNENTHGDDGSQAAFIWTNEVHSQASAHPNNKDADMTRYVSCQSLAANNISDQR